MPKPMAEPRVFSGSQDYDAGPETRRDEARPSDSWDRICRRLRAELGEEVFTSWFGRLELDCVIDGIAHLSVPTKFLKSWIQSHYLDRMLAVLSGEIGEVRALAVDVRSASRAPSGRPLALGIGARPDEQAPRAEPFIPAHAERGTGSDRPMMSAVADKGRAVPREAESDVLSGSPLDRRMSFDTFHVGRSNQLAHAAAQRIAGAGPEEVLIYNPLYIHACRRARQDAPAAGDGARGHRARPPRHLPHRREVHVRLRAGAEGADRARLQGAAPRHRRPDRRRRAVPAGQVDPAGVLPHDQRAARRPQADRRRRRSAPVRSRSARGAGPLAAVRRALRGDRRARPRPARRSMLEGRVAAARATRPASTCPPPCSPTSPRDPDQRPRSRWRGEPPDGACLADRRR